MVGGISILSNNTNIVDAVNAVQQKKNDEVAVLISKCTNKKKRASAPLIGGVFGMIQGLIFGALYAVSKKFPNLPKKYPILNWGINKVERFTNKFKCIKNIKNPILKGMAAFALNTSWMVASGAATGYAFNLYKTFKNTQINGKISHTKQGDLGDCWLLSGLNSLSYIQSGKQAIKDAITKNEDGSTTVSLKGINKSYNISKKELDDASNAYIPDVDNKGEVHGYIKKYSKGDGDTLAFELAFEKYRDDLKDGKIQYNSTIPSYAEDGTTKSKYSLDGGTPNQVYYLLTGKESCHINNDKLTDLYKNNSPKDVKLLDLYSKMHLNKFLNDYASNPQEYTAAFNIKNPKNTVVRDAYFKKVEITGNHVYAIKNITNKNVTIVNPKNSRNPIVLPLKTFKNNLNQLWYTNMQDSNKNSELALKKYADLDDINEKYINEHC